MGRVIPESICAIFKVSIVLVCAIVLQGFRDNSTLDGSVFARLPAFSVEHCAYTCNQNDHCYGWNFFKPTASSGIGIGRVGHIGQCELLHPVGHAFKPSQCCEAGFSMRTFISAESNVALNNPTPFGVSGTETTLTQTTPEVCWANCMNDPMCRAWSYNPPNDVFFITDPKCISYQYDDRYAVDLAKQPCDGCLSGTKGLAGAWYYDEVKKISLNVRVHRNLVGHDYLRLPFIGSPPRGGNFAGQGGDNVTFQYNVFPLNSPEQCSLFCDNDRNCDAWTWASSEHTDPNDPNSAMTQVCHLKDYGCIDDDVDPHGVGNRICTPSALRRFVPIDLPVRDVLSDPCCISGARNATKIDGVSVSRSLPAEVGPLTDNSVTADCPAGKTAIGAGYFVGSADPDKLFGMEVKQADVTAGQATVRFRNANVFGPAPRLQTFVSCVGGDVPTFSNSSIGIFYHPFDKLSCSGSGDFGDALGTRLILGGGVNAVDAHHINTSAPEYGEFDGDDTVATLIDHDHLARQYYTRWAIETVAPPGIYLETGTVTCLSGVAPAGWSIKKSAAVKISSRSSASIEVTCPPGLTALSGGVKGFGPDIALLTSELRPISHTTWRATVLNRSIWPTDKVTASLSVICALAGWDATQAIVPPAIGAAP